MFAINFWIGGRGGPQPANFLSFNLPTFHLQPANYLAPSCQLFTNETLTEKFVCIILRSIKGCRPPYQLIFVLYLWIYRWLVHFRTIAISVYWSKLEITCDFLLILITLFPTFRPFSQAANYFWKPANFFPNLPTFSPTCQHFPKPANFYLKIGRGGSLLP